MLDVLALTRMIISINSFYQNVKSMEIVSDIKGYPTRGVVSMTMQSASNPQVDWDERISICAACFVGDV